MFKGNSESKSGLVVEPAQGQHINSSTANYIELFGSGGMTLGSEVVPLSSGRTMQLAVLLAVRRTWQRRAVLAACFWPDRTEHVSRCNLRNLLHKLQRELPNAKIESSADVVRWHVESDLDRFDVAMAEGNWNEAIRLGEEDLLPGMELGATADFAEWLFSERDLYRRRWQDAVRAELLNQRKRADFRVQLASRWLERYPFSDEPVRELIQALLELGARAQATSVYKDFALRLSREMGTQPPCDLLLMVEPTTLFLGSKSSDPRPTPTRMALQDDVFVGRVLEQRRLHAMIANPDAWCINICGMGGVGKTTLAYKVFESRESGAARQLWLTATHLTSTAEVLSNLAILLGLDECQGSVSSQNIAAKLGGDDCCLFIDGVEHLKGLRDFLNELRSSCPTLKLVTTSRKLQGCDDEWPLLLGGLPLPDSDERDVSILLSNDSVRLFVNSALRSGTALNIDTHAESIVALVSLVEGLPLALRLLAAAAWSLPLPVLLAKMREAVTFGVNNRSTCLESVMPQLAVCVARSVSLLEPDQRTALVRLAVFPDECSLDAATAVAGAPVAVLLALVAQSLVRVSDTGTLSLHPIVRASTVTHAGEELSAQLAFLNFFTLRIEELQRDSKFWSVVCVRRFIRDEWLNITCAWEIAGTLGSQEASIIIIGALLEHGMFLEASCDLYPLFAAGLSRLEERLDASLRLRAMLLAGVALIELSRHDYLPAMTHAQAAVSVAIHSQCRDALRIATQVQASLYVALTRLEDARLLLARAWSMNDLNGNERFAMQLCWSEARLAVYSGDYDLASMLFVDLIDYLRKAADAPTELRCLLFQAETAAELGDFARAFYIQQTASRLLGADGVPPTLEAEVLSLGASILCDLGELSHARKLLDLADDLAGEGLIGGGCEVFLLQCNCSLKIAEGRIHDALRQLPGLLLLAINSSAPYLLARALILAARWYRLAGSEEECLLLLRVVGASTAPASIRAAAKRLMGSTANVQGGAVHDLAGLAANTRIALLSVCADRKFVSVWPTGLDPN